MTTYFYGEQRKNGCFSQWHSSKFTDKDGNVFSNCEQWMMYNKAMLFEDVNIAKQIMKGGNPKTVKALGRQVKGFHEKTWKKERMNIVIQGNYYKFSQNDNFKKKLLDTGDTELVEASPYDRIWGIGFTADKAEGKRNKWGLNLLGKALVEVRTMLANENP
jgi:ribA/ribD-fused uncharacterized protein